MKTIGFEDLYCREFSVTETTSKPQNWYSRGDVYDSLSIPKQSHTFLWFKNCSGTVTDSEKNTLEVPQGALIYTPKDSRYVIRFHGTHEGAVDTVVIHFQLHDADGEAFVPTTVPVICLKHTDPTLEAAMTALAEEFKKNIVCTPEAKAVVYRIFTDTVKRSRRKDTQKRFPAIRAGIELLEDDSPLSIREIAAACGIGECYFRRMFKEYSGDTPNAFRQKHRIERAKGLLLSDDRMTVGEIAAELGFSDIYHFSKTFKALTGLSPSAFVKAAGR